MIMRSGFGIAGPNVRQCTVLAALCCPVGPSLTDNFHCTDSVVSSPAPCLSLACTAAPNGSIQGCEDSALRGVG
jgi:hypothetical protein